MGKTFSFQIDRRKVVCDIWSHPLEIMLVRLPLDDGQEKNSLQLWSHAPEFEWKDHPPLLMSQRKVVCNI